MYISEICIDGFLSYHSETRVEGLSRNVNIILGPNGSGKSNFFAAIRYVLGELGDGRTARELQFNGRGKRADHSLVEITFAETDGKFHDDQSTITFGREIGARGADKYYINRKLSSKGEFRMMLDMAGLSSEGNAFFIVPQGVVTSLARASDEQRMDTLLVASGAKTFEERKSGSIKTLSNANIDLERVREILSNMESRLGFVASEADNLKEYIELRKEARGIEFVLLNVERLRTSLICESEQTRLAEMRTKLDLANKVLAEREAALNEAKATVTNTEMQVAQDDIELSSAKCEVARCKEELKALSSSTRNLTQVQDLWSQYDLSLSLSRPNSAGSVNPADYDRDVDMTELVSESDVLELKGRLSALQKKLSAEVDKMTNANSTVRSLQLKQGRAAQSNKQELSQNRQEAVERSTKMVESIESDIASASAELAKSTSHFDELKANMVEAEDTLRQAVSEEREALTEQDKAGQDLRDAQADRDSARLALRKAEITIENLRKKADLLGKQIAKSGNSSSLNGIGKVKELVASLNLGPGKYHGVVADLIDVAPTAESAVERVAGRQLFYHVVDNAETVETLVSAMQALGPTDKGVVTFVPLADLIVDEKDPLPESDCATPLASLVKISDARFNKLSTMLFGRTMMCKDLNTAVKYASVHHVPAITMDGDFCDTRGALTGGYGTSNTELAGTGTSVWKQIRALSETQTSIQHHMSIVGQQRSAIDVSNQLITQCIDAFNKRKTACALANKTRQECLNNKLEANMELQRLEAKLAELRSTISNHDSRLKVAISDLKDAGSESRYAGCLTTREEEDLEKTLSEIPSVQAKCDELASQEYTMSKDLLDLELIYERQQMKLTVESTENAAAAYESRLSVAQVQEALSNAQSEAARRRRSLDELNDALTEAQENLATTEESLRRAEADCKFQTQKINVKSTKIQALDRFMEELAMKMEGLGRIPEDALTEAQLYDTAGHTSDGQSSFSQQDLKTVTAKLTAKLDNVKEKQSDLGEVNQSAANDHENFTSTLHSLQTQFTRLQEQRSKIQETIDHLESQKQSKLDKMLSKVEDKFKSYFYLLSGGHEGKLVLNRDNETSALLSIGIEVSYTESTATMSGGQNTICALALILATQACDPAPFYIFDEIDANLDENARRRVAETIRQISEKSGTQFICTTFQNELACVGDVFFGISYDKNDTTVSSISKEDAIDFISGRPNFAGISVNQDVS